MTEKYMVVLKHLILLQNPEYIGSYWSLKVQFLKARLKSTHWICLMLPANGFLIIQILKQHNQENWSCSKAIQSIFLSQNLRSGQDSFWRWRVTFLIGKLIVLLNLEIPLFIRTLFVLLSFGIKEFLLFLNSQMPDMYMFQIHS